MKIEIEARPGVNGTSPESYVPAREAAEGLRILAAELQKSKEYVKISVQIVIRTEEQIKEALAKRRAK